jgi:hypothetical protein
MTLLRQTRHAALALACALAPALAAPALAHDSPVLGKVHFPTSCAAKAQPLFDRALAYQHSFWYRAAYDGFKDVLKADANCAIAHWGIALSLLFNPFSAPPAQNLADGLAALDAGLALKPKTARERGYIEALRAFYADHDKLDHRTRVLAYAKAMEALAARLPGDPEAQIFYALSLVVAASPADKTYANQLKAAAILERTFKAQPQHPGAAHYLIHTYDYPAIAHKGIPAARKYATIAPAAPHAQHMPSHIFTRVGFWQDSIDSNLASAKSAAANKEVTDLLHALDYVVYAYLQTARDRAALAAAAEMAKVEGVPDTSPAAHFALAAAPARHAIERGDWKAAASLTPRTSRFAFADAMTHFARALGAARSGDPAAARADLAKLAGLAEALRRAKDAYWTLQVEIQHRAAEAWILEAEGKRDEALAAMKAAVEAEARTDKHPITPGPLAPARELLGEMLLARGLAKEALAAFEETLKHEPNRFRTLYGAAKAAEKSGDAAKARRYFAALAKVAEKADTVRPELAEARAAAAKK